MQRWVCTSYHCTSINLILTSLWSQIIRYCMICSNTDNKITKGQNQDIQSRLLIPWSSGCRLISRSTAEKPTMPRPLLAELLIFHVSRTITVYILHRLRYFNIFPLSTEVLGGKTNRVITDSRYNGARYSEARLYTNLKNGSMWRRHEASYQRVCALGLLYCDAVSQ